MSRKPTNADLPPSRYGPSRVPGNVPRPAAGPADARDPRSIPMGSGMLGNARNALVNRRERLDEEERKATGSKPKPTERPRNMAGGGAVKPKAKGKCAKCGKAAGSCAACKRK